MQDFGKADLRESTFGDPVGRLLYPVDESEFLEFWKQRTRKTKFGSISDYYCANCPQRQSTRGKCGSGSSTLTINTRLLDNNRQPFPQPSAAVLAIYHQFVTYMERTWISRAEDWNHFENDGHEPTGAAVAATGVVQRQVLQRHDRCSCWPI